LQPAPPSSTPPPAHTPGIPNEPSPISEHPETVPPSDEVISPESFCAHGDHWNRLWTSWRTPIFSLAGLIDRVTRAFLPVSV
jgi:hypothetical protein